MAVSTTSNQALSPLNVYYEKQLLPRLIQRTPTHNLAYKKTLPNGNGRTISWLIGGIQAANVTPLVEGIPVTPAPTTSQVITAQTFEYGNVFALSSFLGFTSVVDGFEYLSEQTEQAMAYALEALYRNEIFNSAQTTFGVNQFAANEATSINNITSSDILTMNEVRFARFFLEQNAVPTKKGDKYSMTITTGQKYDLSNNTNNNAGSFLTLAQQSPYVKDIKDAYSWAEDGAVGKIGEYGGVDIYSTALNPVVLNTGGVNVHYSAAWGDASLAGVDLEGEKPKIFTKGPSKEGVFDTLEMLQLAQGYKMGFAAKNLSQDYVNQANQRIVTIGSASSMF